jgi:hypothetical protein
LLATGGRHGYPVAGAIVKKPRPPWYRRNDTEHDKARDQWVRDQLEPPSWRDLSDDEYLQLRFDDDDVVLHQVLGDTFRRLKVAQALGTVNKILGNDLDLRREFAERFVMQTQGRRKNRISAIDKLKQKWVFDTEDAILKKLQSFQVSKLDKDKIRDYIARYRDIRSPRRPGPIVPATLVIASAKHPRIKEGHKSPP